LAWGLVAGRSDHQVYPWRQGGGRRGGRKAYVHSFSKAKKKEWNQIPRTTVKEEGGLALNLTVLRTEIRRKRKGLALLHGGRERKETRRT